jgi:hypothetical protein
MVVRSDSPNPPTPSVERQPLATIDEALRDTCAQIYERLGRLEAALQRTEGFVADKPWDVATIAYKRLERVEQTMRLMQRSLDDSTVSDMCVNLERQLLQTRMAVERTEYMLARTEGLLAGWRREAPLSIPSVPLSVPSAQRAVEPASPAPTVRRAPRAPWMPRAVVPAFAVVLIAAMATFIWASRGSSPQRAAVRAAAPPIAASSPRPVAVSYRESSSPITLPVKAPSIAREAVTAAPSRQRPGRAPEAFDSGPQTFVGAVSITSVPSGASVSINGKAAGVTPLRLPRQRAGSLAVQIAQDGFERWSAAVRVPADQLTQVTARLRPIVQ